MSSEKTPSGSIKISKLLDIIGDLNRNILGNSLPPSKPHIEDLITAIKYTISSAEAKPYSKIQKELEKILGKVIKIAALNFRDPLELPGDNGPLDGLATGLNMLSEELERTVVSRESLEKSERELRSVFEQTAIGVIFLDLEGHIIKCNEQYASFCETSPELLKGKSIKHLISDGSFSQHASALDQIVQTPYKSISFEKQLKRKNGQSFWCYITLSAVYDDNRQLAYFLAIVNDVSEIKRLKQKEKQLEKKLG